jgi:hypothetical protein
VLEGRSKPKLGPGKAAPTAETKGIYTEDHKGHKGAWLAIVDAVNWSTSDGPLDTRKGNSETFVIFAAFCANPRFKSFNSNEAILTRIVDTAFILPRGD